VQLKAMWIFMIAVGLGFGFMLHALVQFFRESRRAGRSHRADSNGEVPRTHSGRLVVMASRSANRVSTAGSAAEFGRG
jgi:hypothetical protein